MHGSPDLPHRVAAEFLGTFVLMAGGCAAAAVDYRIPGILGGHAGIAVAWGLIVAMIIFAIGHLSGAHINPAVTLSFAAGRHFPWREVLPYWGAQIAGGICGALAIAGLFGTGSGLSLTQPHTVNAGTALIIEAAITAILMLIAMAVATGTREQGVLAAVAFGITVTAIGFIMGPITGASMNPARSIAPAVATGDFANLWLYIVGPLVGGLFGVGIYLFLRVRPQPEHAHPDAQTGEDLP